MFCESPLQTERQMGAARRAPHDAFVPDRARERVVAWEARSGMTRQVRELDVGEGASDADLAILCRSCGLCCDGSLFGRVDLEPEEVGPARRRRLRVVASGKSFEQPCAALASDATVRGERRCSIYAERPLSCRRFACRLYERHRQQGGPVEERLAIARRVRLLMASLEASGLEAVDLKDPEWSAARLGPEAEEKGTPPKEARAMDEYLELERSVEDNFARAR